MKGRLCSVCRLLIKELSGRRWLLKKEVVVDEGGGGC